MEEAIVVVDAQTQRGADTAADISRQMNAQQRGEPAIPPQETAPAPASEKGPIPYDRFRDLNDKYKEASSKLEALKDYDDLKRRNEAYERYYSNVSSYIQGLTSGDEKGTPADGRAATDKGETPGAETPAELRALMGRISQLEQGHKSLNEATYQAKKEAFFAKVDKALDARGIPEWCRDQVRNYATDAFTGSLTPPEESIAAAAKLLASAEKRAIEAYSSRKAREQDVVHEVGSQGAPPPESENTPIFSRLGSGTKSTAHKMAEQMGMFRK